MIKDVKSYHGKCLFPVLLLSVMVTSAQIDFTQILRVVYPGTQLALTFLAFGITISGDNYLCLLQFYSWDD